MNVFIINGHQKYPFSEGKLNASLVEKAEKYFKDKGFEVRKTTMEDEYEATQEIEKFKWADV
ncbi:MAG: flavodoxin family protein, partial [Bacteroidota bacterium]